MCARSSRGGFECVVVHAASIEHAHHPIVTFWSREARDALERAHPARALVDMHVHLFEVRDHGHLDAASPRAACTDASAIGRNRRTRIPQHLLSEGRVGDHHLGVVLDVGGDLPSQRESARTIFEAEAERVEEAAAVRGLAHHTRRMQNLDGPRAVTELLLASHRVGMPLSCLFEPRAALRRVRSVALVALARVGRLSGARGRAGASPRVAGARAAHPAVATCSVVAKGRARAARRAASRGAADLGAANQRASHACAAARAAGM
mmetsp:Transcript_40560/g.94708  ORF Transcript_40560/g.94708 Transcript_40560/m.94708 type:complete len:264 (+) Transcript_40560:657-1448(+)